MSVDVNYLENRVGMEPWIALAELEVWKQEGIEVSVARKAKQLVKFGRSEEVNSTAYQTLALFKTGVAEESFLTTDAIDSVSSSDAADDQDLVIEGHTIDGSGNLTFLSQPVTLDGQTRVALTTPLARATRAYNDNATNLLGTVYTYENSAITAGVPDDGTKSHLTIPIGRNQSFKAATSISKDDYWFITGIFGSVLRQTGADIDVVLEIREKGKVFRQRPPFGLASDGGASFQIRFKPYLIVKANSDVRLRAIAAQGSAIDVSGTVMGPLASIIPAA